jgi:uncharacterized protein YbaP (TraB family)
MLRPIAALLLTLAAPAAVSETVAPPRPALWKVQDADTTIWLFGTIHALPKGYGWRGAAVDRALASADGLVLETVLDADPARIMRLMATIGRSPGLPPLTERVGPGKRRALAEMVARSGMPIAALDGMETWAAAMLLIAVSLRDIGIDGEGVEPQVSAMFRSAGKPIEGLETVEQQLGFFDTLPEATQRELLNATLDAPNEVREKFHAMMAAWARGDEQAIVATFDEELKSSPELRAVLLDRRNASWSEWTAKRLDRPGTVFVAVGAGHMAGEGSLPHLLRARGLTVERVQ